MVLWHWVIVIEHHYSLCIPLELMNTAAGYYSRVNIGFLAKSILWTLDETGCTTWQGRKEMLYLMTHSTHFIYGYMASDIW